MTFAYVVHRRAQAKAVNAGKRELHATRMDTPTAPPKKATSASPQVHKTQTLDVPSNVIQMTLTPAPLDSSVQPLPSANTCVFNPPTPKAGWVAIVARAAKPNAKTTNTATHAGPTTHKPSAPSTVTPIKKAIVLKITAVSLPENKIRTSASPREQEK